MCEDITVMYCRRISCATEKRRNDLLEYLEDRPSGQDNIATCAVPDDPHSFYVGLQLTSAFLGDVGEIDLNLDSLTVEARLTTQRAVTALLEVCPLSSTDILLPFKLIAFIQEY